MNIDITLVIRKTGHFFVFFMLAYFLYTIIKNILNKKSSIYVWVLFLCLLIGVLDEFYQSFIKGRTSSVRDVVIDFAGVIFFFILKEVVNIFEKVVKHIIEIIFKRKNINDKQI
ncbi:VanZ family protein [Oceanirhabdus sp. W0125-5]|uniref:VanZ family protein n=1 Tax=Oceanirhabdus sp. W0125-5 TaxID=2999116 RepID=UPI0022F3082E|nr:VanZ family protein [Oceanirhabdus sp. W0125-5]WBW98970.1 VanZ family protein [Oceanirhabdus sp. W0125-5]